MRNEEVEEGRLVAAARCWRLQRCARLQAASSGVRSYPYVRRQPRVRVRRYFIWATRHSPKLPGMPTSDAQEEMSGCNLEPPQKRLS